VTSSDVIYLHRPSQENLIELEGMDEAQEEWWKLAYDETADQPIQVEVRIPLALPRAGTNKPW